MAHSQDEALSRVELVVLARLTKSNPPSEDQLRAAVLELCVPDATPDRTRVDVPAIVKELRRRRLVSPTSMMRTDSGSTVLRKALGVTRAPAWDRVPTLLAALALGVPAGSSATKTAVTEDSLIVTVLCKKLGVARAASTTSLCDSLIADSLGMEPGEVTLNRIRAHFLARRAATNGADASADPAVLAASLVRAEVGARLNEQRPIAKALGRRWVCGPVATKSSGPTDSRVAAPVQTAPTAVAAQASGPPLLPVAANLLEVVRETIPRVGADGRYGSEKVFVSAIWRSIERDRRLGDLSLDYFKRWLVGANRDGWLVLARADLVGAMDRKLVSESEIEDRGATFHFVLDQRNGASVPLKETHAR
jgi:hypothetical protein